MPYYPILRQRPPNFRLNPASPLVRGLAFAGLGQHYGATYYQDESPNKNHGGLTGYAGSSNGPRDQWQWIPQLARWGLGFDGSHDYVELPSEPSLDFSGGRWTMGAWVRIPPIANDYQGLLAFNNYGIIQETPGHFGGLWNNAMGNQLTSSIGSAGWVHLVVRQTGASASAFDYWVNGAQASQTAHSDSGYGGAGHNWLGKSYGLFQGSVADPFAIHGILAPSVVAALADPANVDLRVGGVPLILPPMRRSFASAVKPVPAALGPCKVQGGRVFTTGAAAGQVFTTGATAGDVFTAGTAAGAVVG